MNLTIEQQRKLTEFLGECWHEPRTDTGPIELIHFGGSSRCAKCGERLDLNLPFNKHGHRLDFTDWRVVGRLIEKAGGLQVEKMNNDLGWYCWLTFKPDTPLYATPQEAICLAVLAWLEGEK